MVTKIFTSSDVTVFFFTIAERRKNKIIKEVLNQLKKNYPYEIQKNNFILEKNKDKNSYICFVKKTPFSNERNISRRPLKALFFTPISFSDQLSKLGILYFIITRSFVFSICIYLNSIV